MTAICPPHSAGAAPKTEDEPKMSDTTNHDDVTEWAEELWQRSIDCDSESGPRLIAHALLRASESGDPAGARSAPAWVQSVTPAEIVRQRSLKWPDFHPEDFCHRCGKAFTNWSASRKDWLTATSKWAAETGREGICCIDCFAEMHEGATGQRSNLVVSFWRGSWEAHGDATFWPPLDGTA